MILYYITCLSALTAALVAWVGVQQYRLAHERLKLDLWEKRYAIYKGAHRFLSLVLQTGATDLKELLGFLEDTRDAIFLFRPDMAAYLEGLYRKGVDLRTTRLIYQNNDGDERSQLIDKEARLLAELGDELVQLKHRFSPYLKLARK